MRYMENKNDNAALAVAIAAYFSLAALLSLVTYLDQKRSQDRWINALLHQGVESMRASLPEGLHDKAISGEPLDYEDERALSYLLWDLSQSHGLKYLYTLVRADDGNVKFVTSSPTPDEYELNEYESVYLEDYFELNDTLAPLFDSSEDLYLEYSDRWGEFRSIFRPVETATGQVFMLGADIDIAEVKKAALISAVKTAIMLALIFLMCTPLVYLILRSRQREMKIKMEALLTDPMTKLGNRVALTEDLKTMKHPHLLILDVIKFTDINNAYGPAKADQIVCKFAKHLKNFQHPALVQPKIYRMYGDEFAVAIDQEKLPPDMDELFKDFLNYVTSFQYNVSYSDTIRVKVCAGVVLNRTHDLVTSAKIAHLTAQEKSKPLVVFDEDLPQAAGFRENLRQLETLRAAIKEDRLIAWFQPIFDSRSGDVVSYEALARIIDDNGDIELMPDEFLPVAHRYRIYYKVTRAVLKYAVKWMTTNDCKVSINLSISDIEHKGTREYIIRTIHQSGMGSRLSFELLESESITDMDLTKKFFAQLARLGCTVGIDDLGKEYSNFDRLMALPLDFVKLDGSVIEVIVEKETGFSLVEKIVTLAHQNDLRVTAEVISSEKHMQVAKLLHCDYAQGYYLGLPGPDQFQRAEIEQEQRLSG